MSTSDVEAQMERHRERALQAYRKPLEWDERTEVEPIRISMPGPDEPGLVALRTQYDLDNVVAGASDDYDKLRRVVKWVHDRWSHSGDNTPSKSDPLTILAEAGQGKRFRCVEYSIVVAGCAQALGMPARVLGLKRKDVETARSGAGHVVAEVWLASRGKWVMADGQWDAIPEKDGVPLSAVEFQAAFAAGAGGLRIRSSSSIVAGRYIAWVVPYLYYFDFNRDQHLFGSRTDHADNTQRYQPQRGKIMLVPKGAAKPKVFQRKTPIGNCTYISSPRAFHAPPQAPSTSSP
jgi:transglutaminase-like putative cysteine protease